MSIRSFAPAVLLTASMAVAGASVAARAQAAEAFTPAAPVVYDFSGPYAGLSAGASWQTFDAAFGFVPTPGAFDATGFTGGIFAGIQAQSDRFVYGAEADVNFNTGDETRVIAGVPVTAENDWFATLRGRVGYAAGNVLLYGTGGLAVGNVAVSGAGLSASDTRVGWTLGAGLEAALTNNFTLRGEYLYTDLGKTDGTLGGVPFASEFDSHTVRAGITYQFR
ncbi:outer membrane immunogenic protein [Tepidamorphus gemmatus]|jgi:outer membrane immunogenic protein|uniref:Outer membrane immunogenic protein n=1 Tax=Tepidamorphus gemmatus TaxID=747076 RepID=A0A4R3MJP1_9HYPH|nr:outer membrane protein [Tepidamorphus gemmatus]TCT13644.1 outer membrane immunogenic protein [Tepidamorphus gemmatus]